MVALQVRRFDKTYEFKINLLQVRSVFECRCRLAVRAGHDPRPARSYITARTRAARAPGPRTRLYARNNEQRGAERSTHACARLQ